MGTPQFVGVSDPHPFWHWDSSFSPSSSHVLFKHHSYSTSRVVSMIVYRVFKKIIIKHSQFFTLRITFNLSPTKSLQTIINKNLFCFLNLNLKKIHNLNNQRQTEKNWDEKKFWWRRILDDSKNFEFLNGSMTVLVFGVDDVCWTRMWLYIFVGVFVCGCLMHEIGFKITCSCDVGDGTLLQNSKL